MEDLSGQTLKGYKLLERIGAGGYSAVYRALQSTVGRQVAVKIILPGVASQPEFIRRFEIEAQLIARLEHLHIVPLYDFWRDPAGAYLVMRWLRGGSLAQALNKGPFDLPAAVHLLDQVASGLAAAHNNRIVHRDLKPSNILLDEEGNAFLSDFGIARDLSQALKDSQLPEDLVGSLDYLAPEQARGQEITPRIDLYSLGVTLYETLTGQYPFPGLSSVERLYKHIDEPLPPIETLDPAISAGVNAVIQKATAKDPLKRYEQALDMAAAFRQAARLDEEGSNVLLKETLTQREQEILAHIVAGHSNKQIATALFIELPTVKWHITQLYRKMGVRSRMQAAVRARELNLMPSGQEDTGPDKTSAGTISVALAKPVNPYKGLRPFKAADSRDFFGREALIEKLLDRLRQPGEMARFLAVLGPSGSGKSSLLSAGLVPAIWAGKLPGSERWFVVEMAPGPRPLDELEVALTRIAADQASNLHAHLNRDAGGLLRAASLILPNDGSELFLVIDQFEEIFILTRDQAARDHFLDLIFEAVTAPRSRVRVVIVMRADFYDRPLHNPGFGELVRSRMETLLPLSAEELHRAIVRPARQVGVKFDPGLPARIIEELLYQPGALPLLQYALTELFESREGRIMTHRAYQDIGGAVGALALRAEEIYLGFDHAAREAARQMFLRLVNLGEGSGEAARSPHTRRKVRRAELLALVEDPDLMDEVIDTFGAYRMLSLDHDSASRQPTLELAHEALIGEWRRLEAWLAESREDLLQYRRFQTLAREWHRTRRDPGYLLREARLDQFAAWAQGTGLALTAGEQAFLEASLQARESRQQLEERRRQRELETAQALAETQNLRAEEQGRANRRLKWLSFGLAIFLFAAIGAALFGWAESRRAVGQARIAFARELASQAVRNLDGDPDLSIYLALQAVQITREKDGFVLPVAEEALHRALQASRLTSTFPQSGGLAFSPDGLHLAIGGTRGSIGIWDARTGEPLNSLAGHVDAVTSIAFSPDGRLLATASADYHRIVWDFSTGRQVLNLPGPDAPAFTRGLSKVVFSPTGKFLLSTAQFEEAAIWDVASGQEIVHFEDSAGPAAAFSPDGRKLALMTAVWDVSGILMSGTGTADRQHASLETVLWQERLFDYSDPFIEFQSPSSAVDNMFQEPGSVSFSPDGTRLLTTVISSLGVMRDADSGEPLFTLSGHSDVINHTAFDPGGARVATAGADGTARVWDAGSGRLLSVLEGHQDEVLQVAFSPDGQSLATSSADGTTKVWDISAGGGGEWLNPTPHAGSVLLAFDPRTPHLVTVGEDGVVNNLDLQAGKSVFSLGGSQDAFAIPAFSLDGTLLALADAKGAVHLFEASKGERLRSFQLGRIASVLAFSPQGDLLFAGSEDGFLSVLDLNTGEILAEWLVQDGFVNDLAFSRDGRTLAIAGAGGDVIVAGLDLILPAGPLAGRPRLSGQLPANAIRMSLIGHTDVITDLDVSPDGTKLLTASWDGTARVWDALTGEQLLKLAGHKGRVWRAAFHPNAGRIATAGADGSVIVWDSGRGEQLFVLGSQSEGLFDLAFSSDGKFLAASDTAGTVRLYVMPLEDLVALARDRLTRQLTDEECLQYLHVAQCP